MKRVAKIAKYAIGNKPGISRSKYDIVKNVIHIYKNPNSNYDKYYG